MRRRRVFNQDESLMRPPSNRRYQYIGTVAGMHDIDVANYLANESPQQMVARTRAGLSPDDVATTPSDIITPVRQAAGAGINMQSNATGQQMMGNDPVSIQAALELKKKQQAQQDFQNMIAAQTRGY